MVCDTSQNSVFPAILPPFPGGLFSPIQIGLPSFDLPKELVEDIEALLKELTAIFPSGTFKPSIGNFAKTPLDYIMNLLAQLAPYLSLYKFFTAIINIIVCIIDVLCSLTNPFALAAAIIKLFSQCIPAFILLFPIFAIIAMIIAILLLIIALITYIIETVLAIILAIIANLEILSQGLQLNDAQSTLAALSKIASLLCIIQNILAVLVALAAIMGIIEALAAIAGVGICDNSSSNCCAAPVCPDFVRLTPDGIPITTGRLIYHKQIGTDTKTVFASLNIPGIQNLLNIPPIRSETWQIVNDDLAALYPISVIITPVFDINNILTNGGIGNIFWPQGVTLPSNTSKNQSPYTVDLRVAINPANFGVNDPNGKRFFQIKDAIVISEPYIGILDQANNIDLTSFTGTLSITGGQVFEDDGVTPYKIKGKQATLETLIHQDPLLAGSSSDIPATDDAITFEITGTWKPNAAALAGYNLVTMGCLPNIAIEKAIQNSVIQAEGIAPVNQKITLPDVNRAITCANDALAKFRTNVSAEGAAEFQASIVSCLTVLQNEAQEDVCSLILSSSSQFKSTFAIDTDVQFTTRLITATVVLFDAGGTEISNNIPPACVPEIEAAIEGHVTLGQITSFTYDGSHAFNASISSTEPGDGQLSMSFNGKIFSTVAQGTPTSTITETLLDYTFITGIVEPEVRRDASDVSNVAKE